MAVARGEPLRQKASVNPPTRDEKPAGMTIFVQEKARNNP